MSEIDQILELVETQKIIDLAKGHLENTLEKLNHVTSDFYRLGHLLNDKYESIERLQAKSLSNTFKSILGNKDLELEMERQEYLQVVLQYNEAKNSIELLEYERDLLKNQVNQEAVVALRLEKAIKEHRASILASYPDVADKVIKLEKVIANHSANQKELTEAAEVARTLRTTLEIIITNLERASNWGDWEDMKLSQKLEVKAKNLFVDKALAQVFKAQNLFYKFEKELKDIHNHQNITGSYHFHDFGNFTEVYYNRLIADWIIQKRIKNSKENVEGVLTTVNMISASLTYEIDQTKGEIDALKQQIEHIIKAAVNAS